MTEMKCNCGHKMYGYTDDDEHEIFVCYNCGKFEGSSNGDTEFMDMVTDEPLVIISMIENKQLRPF